MSEKFQNLQSSLNEEILKEIECLDLPVIQKHHVRLLIHCLQVFKEISSHNNNSFPSDQELKKWCETKASKFEDNAFSELLLRQMCAARGKLLLFSKEIQKNMFDLDVNDLVVLAKQNVKNR